MSHFTCLVIGSNPEKQLAPFQENNMSNCPKEYLKFNDVEDELMKKYAEENVEAVRMPDGNFKFKHDFYIPTNPKEIFSEKKLVIPEGLKIEEIPFKEIYKTFAKFMKEWNGYSRDKETGRYGYWENPQAKWDYYQLGGRWSGFFKLKRGKKGTLGKKSWANEGKVIDTDRADQVLKGDIDFEGMKKENFEKFSKKYDEFEALMESDPEKAKNDSYWIYGIENKGDKDNFIPETRVEFIKRNVCPSTFAVIKDGQWNEKGSMGWWAIVSNEKEAEKWDDEFFKLLEGLPDDTMLSVFDLHI